MRKLLLTVPLVLGLFSSCTEPRSETITKPTSAIFVGTPACATCHALEYESWQGSHHQLAMQVATAETVLGDFSDAKLDYVDTEIVFFMRDGVFAVRTEDEVGKRRDFEITHTFGVEPLQQYLVSYPGGRKQVLPVAWDTRPKDVGGQRWYHLHSDEYITPGDPLHWTGRFYNWNASCAECHSTNIDVGYDAESDIFDTTFTELSVGCESCHGPGSTHIEQARLNQFDHAYGLDVDLNDRRDATWAMNPKTGIAQRSVPNIPRQQAESCGRCHSRRSTLTPKYEYGKHLADTHMPSLLEENLYFSDGRIQGEVYVYGSFIQSKMYAAGVTCSDCHNPHSGELHAGSDPNDTCAQCHSPQRFSSANHSSTNSGDCVACHMKATTYMGVDERRDHSFRLPDSAQPVSHYGSVIDAGRKGNANAVLSGALSNDTIPSIARATMLTLLEPPLNDTHAEQLLRELGNHDPLVRIAALRSLRNQTLDLRMRIDNRLLRDPIRGVRIEAALTFAGHRELLPEEDIEAYARAAGEYRSAMRTSLNFPETAIGLAEFESRHGNTDLAESYYRHAVLLDPKYGAARHAYGLFLVRSGQLDAALPHLRDAVKLEPDIERYAYVLGVALNSLGKTDEAIANLSQARIRFPEDFDIAWSLTTILRDNNDNAAALASAERMVREFPNDVRVAALIEYLRRQ